LIGCRQSRKAEEIPWPEVVETVSPLVAPPANREPDDAPSATEEPAMVQEGSEDAGADESGAQEPVAEASSGKQDKGPARIEISSGDGTMGVVTFKHKMHQQMYGCKKCHHTMEPETTPTGCTACHGADEAAPEPKQAFHNKCKACHNAMGAGPTKCTGCHKK
jgi:hypothetical protein